MKKIYSFVLMAATLLIGTNAWAEGEYTFNGEDYDHLSDAVAAAQQASGATQTISLNENNFVDDENVVINTDKHIVLDLKKKTLKFNCDNGAKNVAIKVERGIFEVKNGTLKNESFGNGTYTVDLIRVIGSNETGIDAAVEPPYSQLIVASDAKVHSVTTPNANKDIKYNALTITEHPVKVNDKAYANGARIDVYGEVKGTTYGIKVNGSIQRPANDSDAPYVYIHAGATVTADETGSGSVAAYSSGYGRWRIEGNCSGSTGLYAKGGDIDIVGNAKITSENSNDDVPTVTGKGSGVSAGGSAIVIESNANYPGQISVTISDNAKIEGNGAYAIEETVDNAVAGTKVESISIQGGTIKGGDAGAVIVDEKTQTGHAVTVVGGNIDGSMEVSGTTVTEKSVVDFLPVGSTSASTAGGDEDYVVVVTPATSTEPVSYEVTPNLSKVVTMNGYGYSTFSTDVNRKIKSTDTGLKAYTAKYNAGELVLTPIASGIIPANNGVVLIGALNQSYSFESVEGTLSDLEDNDLYAASAWTLRDQSHAFFVLSGNMMYKYVGADMKPHKAYFDLDAVSAGAPARIRMVIAETQDVENVEFEAVKAVKFIENGQVLIKRGEKVYNVQGQIVK